jgi:glutathione S-transferase
MTIHLLIGNKNHSSWSLRAWLALAEAGIPFEETVVELYVEGAKEKLLAFSPAGKVPAIRDGDITVWESLSVLEYLAETFPEKHLLPSDKAARAHCRSVSSEMHGGFLALRREMPMDIRARRENLPMSEEALDAAARIDAIWRDCLQRYGGPFLFGHFTIADAMYAPVIYRFRTYGYTPCAESLAYMAFMRSRPSLKAWETAATEEPWVSERLERRE